MRGRFWRIRHAWAVLRNVNDDHWCPREIQQINCEMAEQIIDEIRETLQELGCCHGHDMASTPPMFFREAILCAVAKARQETLNPGVVSATEAVK